MKANLNSFFFLAFFLVLCLFGKLQVRAEAGVHISGNWSVKGVERLEEDIKRQNFDVFIDGEKCFLGIESKKSRSPYYAITTSDGSDSFVIQYPVSWKKNGELTPQAPPQNKDPVFGYVYNGSFPTNQTTAAQIAWIAYALPHQTNIQIGTQCNLPISCIAEDKLADVNIFLMEAQQYTNGNGIQALQSLKIYRPGSGPQKGTKLKFGTIYPAYKKGWLYAEYQVLQFTNIGQRLIPMQFYFRDYLPKQKGEPTNRDDVDFFEEWNFMADRVALDATFPSEFPLEAANSKIIVTDYRLIDESDTPYGFQLHLNGEFMHRNSPEFSRIGRQFGVEATVHTRSRYVFLPIFLLLATIPVVLVLKASRKTTNRKQTTK